MIVIASTETSRIYSLYIIYHLRQRPIQDSILCFVKLNLPLSLLSLSVYFRDRALFARLAFLHDHGGQFSNGGRAATHARGGRSVPPLAGPWWLAGPADCHHQPFRSDAALRLVSPTPIGIPQCGVGGADSSRAEPGDGLYSTHCSTQHWAHSASSNKQYFVSPIVCLLPPPSCFFLFLYNIFCSHPSSSAFSVSI